MAKKKSVKNDTKSSLFTNTMGIVKREDERKDPGGVELKTFAERWLYDSNIIRFGELYMFAGESASGKSQHLLQIAASFIKAGGYGIIIDTEHKSNAAATIIPIVGDKIYYSDRFGHPTAGKIDSAKKVKLGDDKAIDEQIKAWQDMLKQQVAIIKDNPKLRDVPFFIGVDSLLGASSSISRSNYDEGGGSDGRSGSGLARAASITEFLSNFSTDISGTKITIGFVNHGKTKINIGGFSRGGPSIQLPGGDAPKFHCSTILYFTKGAKVTKSYIGGRSVHIKVFKNSFGDDQRSLTTTFYYDIMRDENDVAIRDKQGNPRRRIFWDWDEATAQILKKYCLGSEKDRISAVRKIFPGLDMAGGRVSCKTYKFEKLTLTEFGKEVMRNKELYQKIMEVPRLSIHHADKNSILTPDWSEDIENSAGEGSWNISTEDEDDDDEI